VIRRRAKCDARAASHHLLLHSVAVALALALPGCRPREQATRPSIVLLVVDTLRADHLGAYGYARPTSPRIDALAARGAVFERALAPSSWTVPSVASLLTGEIPSRHGAGAKRSGGDFVRHEGRKVFQVPDPGLSLLAEELRGAGYATAAVVANPFLSPALELDRGFDHYVYLGDAPRAPAVLEEGLRWLDATETRPVFLYLHFFDPHMPYEAGPELAGRFTGPLDTPFALPVERVRDLRSRAGSMSEAERAFVVAAYDEEIAFVDREIGRLLDALDERGLLAGSLVVVTSDHGEELFDHGGFEHGHTLYQELLHVPLVLAGPSIAPQRLEQPVSLVDLAPTLRERAGLAAGPPGPGVSLWPLLRGEESLAPRDLVAEGVLYGPPQQALVRWPRKLILDAGRESRLYDLERDPAEERPLDGASAAQARALEEALRARLDAAAGAYQPAPEAVLSPLTRSRLRALGYVE
jgi:arylsulfatase A-like enzyme